MNMNKHGISFIPCSVIGITTILPIYHSVIFDQSCLFLSVHVSLTFVGSIFLVSFISVSTTCRLIIKRVSYVFDEILSHFLDILQYF